MEQGPTEKIIIEQCIRDRRPFPDAILNAPELVPGLDLYYMAFLDLTSCRAPGSYLPGPIPWVAVNQWCDAHEVTGEQREDVFYHVTHLDKSYLDWSAKKAKQQRDLATKPTKGKVK